MPEYIALFYPFMLSVKPHIASAFKPAWYLRNAHLQTILAKYLAPAHRIATQPETLNLPDGDILQLNWTAQPTDNQPLVILLHGLAGSIDSHYIQGMLSACQQQNWPAVVLHFRGCHGEPNKLPRAYHSGDTADLAFVIQSIRQRHPATPLLAAGFSLGGNVLIKYCGEQAEHNPLTAAVAVSAPLALADSARRINQGFSRIYQRYLLQSLLCSTKEKLHRFQPFPVPLSQQQLGSIQSIEQFDELYTAPIHGFQNAQDYYRRASGKAFLPKITIPTLILHAADDPFLSAQVIPEATELSDSVTFELSQYGGHVGFISGSNPFKPQFWLNSRIPAFFLEQLYT